MRANMTKRLIRIGVLLTIMAPCAVIGAGAAPASASFGITSFDGSTTEAPPAGSPGGTLGEPANHAGEHPFQISTTINFNTITRPNATTSPDGSVKDIVAELPTGFAGNPTTVGTCTEAQLTGSDNEGSLSCPASSQVGTAAVKVQINGFEGPDLGVLFPVYNMVPPKNAPAEFAFDGIGTLIHLFPKVRTDGDYGLTVTIPDIPQGTALFSTTLTLWGTPADPAHDIFRSQGGPEVICLAELTTPCTSETVFNTGAHAGVAPVPFLTLPTSCTGPLTTKVHVDSWEHPGVFVEEKFVSHDNATPPNPLGLEGCANNSFSPTLKVSPDTSQADTPAGLTAEVKVPQDGLLNPSGVASANLKNTTVTLPQGVVINPGQAAGLEACPIASDGVGTEGTPSCPAASKVGTVQITTPLLSDKFEGTIYVLESNPPDLKLLLAASAEGINLKLVGDVHLDESTGQLTTTFENTPQLPFSDLKLAFSGGAQAALATPATCGVYESNADFTPWTTPFEADALSNDSFAITSGPGGSACSSTLPFSPALIAGATTDQAGGFTDFSLLLQRADGQQRISSLQFKVPEGLLGKISSVPLCGEPQAAQGDCPAGSQIGHTVVGAGPGPYPLTVPQPGGPAAPIYLTGPYKGAPYGLTIAVPVVAGPFNLGTVVVRAAIAVDRNTAQLTITTDPLPSILHGVPTDLRTINAVIDRPGFMFNPTSCASQSFGGTATSTEGTVAPISSHFQVGSCQSLKFKPNFSVSTSGKTSRKNGASLDAKIVYPVVPTVDNQASQQANIAKVKVDLPKQLPSRLTTLQKACLASVFEANPGNCPAASVVGSGRAVTPVLGVPLSGPAYFVSHGGEAFPSLVVVLQGAGVRVDLTGSTFISKAGITSSTFKSVPDVPITSFELILPEGPHSALAANGNLCTSALAMPTAFVGQNGAEIHQSTKLKVTGCPKKKTKAKAKQKTKAKKQSTGKSSGWTQTTAGKK
jgi:hypothetical protein